MPEFIYFYSFELPAHNYQILQNQSNWKDVYLWKDIY